MNALNTIVLDIWRGIKKEPVIVAQVIGAVIPVLVILKYLNWDGNQVAAVMTMIGTIVALITRSAVTPNTNVNREVEKRVALEGKVQRAEVEAQRMADVDDTISTDRLDGLIDRIDDQIQPHPRGRAR